ncbi:type II toxin-antitoxin system RelE/ParE family toxin [Tahibacter soli]|uniref:Type II toxin-antitoxin system RelE/ParE family toxin n=1 Tax=Tahibacter soli TaxID=2983605 RepID=A0A9X3YJZ7_9GAMM|nr:type II toxin-antitoxin system RelE/ParE family toxin [Tahibacter soli]MDC8012391.1 type II toxin-antitoxin system RelE/ParE family toxin [Tahibacter soli]
MSSRRVVLRTQAARDVEAAVDYYTSEAGESVAFGFVDAFAKALERLSRHPSSGSLRYSHIIEILGLRSLVLSRYPYVIFYLADGDSIDVWRILHARSDIPAWMSDTDDRPYS